MFIKIPFESVIDFKSNISEISKMSLEHDFNVNEGVVLGNFYISGEYRVHAVSINKEPFNYTLPFTVELRDDIKYDTVEFNIEDFSYDIVDDKMLKVNIEYSLKAEVEEEVLFERVNEDELESELTFIDSFLDNQEAVDKVEVEDRLEVESDLKECVQEVEILDQKATEVRVSEEKPVEISMPADKERIIEREPEVKEARITLEEEKTIMDTIKDSDDTFVTYHIHIVKESETIESICALYKVSNSLIGEYNSLENMTAGDKLLIPQLDE